MEILRKYINKEFNRLLQEEFLEEATINPLIYTQIDNYINKMDFPMNPGINDIEIKNAIKEKMHFKLEQLKQKNFAQIDFNVVKLGIFNLKEGEKISPLTFHIEGSTTKSGEQKNASYFYVYIYRDNVAIIYHASGFYDSNLEIENNIKEFIKAKKINLVTKIDPGKIVFNNTFNTPNTIDITNYGSTNKIAQTKTKPTLAKSKAKYVPGRIFKHPRFGKGPILSTKRDGEFYRVEVQFPDKIRTLMMPVKTKETTIPFSAQVPPALD